MMEELYICRHEETEWTLSGQHTGKTDLPLTQKGRERALLLQKRLEKIPFEKVFTSPMRRARMSCDQMHAVVEPLAVEWDYGDYEGLTSAEIRKKDPDWNLFADGAPHGETAEQVGKRADRFLKIAGVCKGNVALFSHGHFLRVLAARFLGLAPEMGRLFLLSVGSVSILGYERGQPAVALWNVTGF